MFLTTTFIVIMIYVHHEFVMNTVYLARYQGSPVIKLTTKTFAILFITDISIIDISGI